MKSFVKLETKNNIIFPNYLYFLPPPPQFCACFPSQSAAAMVLPKTPSPIPLPSSSLLLFLFFLALQTPLSFSADTISASSSISGDRQLTSEGGNFVLGFFSPPNSTKYYIGIWYKKDSQQTSVWVANREIPVSDKTKSELRLSNDGNLVLLNESKAQIWSTNANISTNSTVAVLQDTGNLVLADGSNSSRILWQSIDHPTDTWLPGGKLGLNKVTKQNQRLISWKSSADPAPGIFSVELDPNGTSQYFIQWNKSVSYWTSGTWNGHVFSGVPEMIESHEDDFTYVNNRDESYFTYVDSDSAISRFIMDPSGRIQQLMWADGSQEWILFWSRPRKQCEVYSLCGPFGSCSEIGLPFCKCVKGFVPRNQTDWYLQDRTGGCVRSTPLQCSSNSSANVEKDKFYPMDGIRLPKNPQNQPDVASAEDCASTCLSNCSCTAYSFGAGCSVWYGDLINLQEQYNGSDAGILYLRLAASELRDSTSKKRTVTGAVACVVAGLVVCVVIIWVLNWIRWKRQMIHAVQEVGRTLVPFRFSDLQHFTKNFSENLGGGGFGSVFKGFLPDSTAIAVKKLEGLRLHGEKQFRAEVSTIGTVQHVNLVRLLGFCSEGTRRLLVYEFMPKGSLDAQLFQNNSMVLDWNKRYQIALGIARGLAYLHEKCRDCIIHFDIKPENILLDASFVPKVADFGLAKLLGRDFSRVLTTMRGTIGYLAPEWLTGAAITAKADVYSYGMMLFEIISGRRNLEQTEEGKPTFFPTLAANRLVQGDVQSLVDHRLGDHVNIEELERACKIAYWCIQDDESARPTMGQVVQILEGFLEINMPPIPRSLQILVESSENINFFSDLSSNQSSQTRSTTSTGSQVKCTASRSCNE
ncbi:G-type lectin S-receptor-like serine/threonine-protein kinase At2g19130 [Elaeis guineensis]|uniref:Receptor-like serine/threonine-protein kinase n=1 Tax=Elaeis guineensis var. tenera TaxID=51953 RepID=A0A6I9RJG0_ELAGV|nr:G-type lectin S-receptor-like serine/threonine-protein kinase At2g19130 [Elaeis guineensis]